MKKNRTPADLKSDFQVNGAQMGMRNPFSSVRLFLLAAMVSMASLTSAQCPTLTGSSSGGSAPAQVENSGGGRTRVMNEKQKAKFQQKMQAMSKPYQFKNKTSQAIQIADAVPDSTINLEEMPVADEALPDNTSEETASLDDPEPSNPVIELPCHTAKRPTTTSHKPVTTHPGTAKPSANGAARTKPAVREPLKSLTVTELLAMTPAQQTRLTNAELAMAGYHREIKEICDCPILVPNPPAPTNNRTGGQLATITSQ